MSMKERDRAKFEARVEAQGQSDPKAVRAALRRVRKNAVTERRASREEQHARYLDCGPQAWDDR